MRGGGGFLEILGVAYSRLRILRILFCQGRYAGPLLREKFVSQTSLEGRAPGRLLAPQGGAKRPHDLQPSCRGLEQTLDGLNVLVSRRFRVYGGLGLSLVSPIQV